MEITEEQRKRAEANRLAALAKLKRAAIASSEATNEDVWKLFKCQKLLSPKCPVAAVPKSENPPPDRFRVVLEICAPDAFSITTERVEDSQFPGQLECLQKINAFLSSVTPFCSSENQCGRWFTVYMLKDYDVVLKCLKRFQGVLLQEIPWKTLAVVQKFSHSFENRWIPCMSNHLTDDEVDVLFEKLPKVLRDALLPFQLDGVRFGLRRGGRCLIADEMGLGKTIQAIAIASCFMNEGPILVICPAVLRFSWAEELERWLPFCLPSDIHLVFGHQNNLIYLTRCPKVVVISYKMLHRLRKNILECEWALMIVDESHNVRCTKKKESEETQAVLDVAVKVKRIILLSGTPSLSRPYDIFHQINMLWSGLLGKDKYEFATNYCSIKLVWASQGKMFKDFSNGIRLQELNVLLKQTLMIRRLKENLLLQLPPKRRQVLRLMLKGPDIALATATCREDDFICRDGVYKSKPVMNGCTSGRQEIFCVINDNHCHRKSASQLSYQELGIAKLSGFREWLSNHSIVTESEDEGNLELGGVQKMIIFAHHLKVLDGVQEFACEKGIEFVRIDGSTLPRDRQEAVLAFQSSTKVRIAIIGVTAGGVGLDLSSAQSVVFLELPKSASEMLQAEDRAHRRGQTNAVNIYIFCAKDTSDESRWQHLNRSLYRISSVMNGKDDAVQEIKVDSVCDLDLVHEFGHVGNPKIPANEVSEVGNSEILPINASDNAINSELEAVEVCSEKSETVVMEQIEGCNNDLIQSGTSHLEVIKVVPELLHSALVRKLEDKAHEAAEVGNPCIDYTSEVDDEKQKKESDSKSSKAISLSDAKRTITEDSSVNLSIQSDKLANLLSEGVEHGASALIPTDTNSSIHADSLRFEVSHYTGRVHLYACIPGKDSRPRPLFENFRPEELETMIFSADGKNNEVSPKLVKENPAYYNSFSLFIKEWNDLRPIERKKLLGKPLQLPLNLELCYLKETINHGCGGLLKGGSKRRVTPLCEISNPLPPNALWKTIFLRSSSAKKEKEYSQAWNDLDEPLCKLCQTPCKGKLAKEPEFFEDLFCDLSCFEEYRIRTSQRSLRVALFQIEHGVCTKCKLDCHKLVERIRPLSTAMRREHIQKVAPKVANNMTLLDKLVYEPTEGNAWHADHIVPVYKGGGECRLENMRTLCIACHSEVTAVQRTERKIMRIKAKEQLKAVMKELKDEDEMEIDASDSELEGEACLAVGDSADELLITVPGSAYSGGKPAVSESEAHGNSCTEE